MSEIEDQLNPMIVTDDFNSQTVNSPTNPDQEKSLLKSDSQDQLKAVKDLEKSFQLPPLKETEFSRSIFKQLKN